MREAYILEVLKNNEGNDLCLNSGEDSKIILWSRAKKMWLVNNSWMNSINTTELIKGLHLDIESITKVGYNSGMLKFNKSTKIEDVFKLLTEGRERTWHLN